MDGWEKVGLSAEEFEQLPNWTESEKLQIGQHESQLPIEVSAYSVAGVLLFLFILVITKIRAWVGRTIPIFKGSKFCLFKMKLVPQVRKITICSTLGIITLMMLFPPWSETTRYLTRPLGYGFLFLPPEATGNHLGVRIDYGRLALQWLVTISIAGLLLMFKLKKDPLV